MKLVCSNPRASHEYFLLDNFEAGIVLSGDEIKSIRAGHVSIKEAFVQVKNGEVWLKNAYIQAYDKGYNTSRNKTDEKKDRKLLLHKREIEKLRKETEKNGLTIMPIKVYFQGSKAKIEISIARGKKLYDKRESAKKKDEERKLRRET